MVLEKLINNYFKATTPAEVFSNIVCHDDLKEIMARSLFTENRTKTLLLGGPGTAKTLFATEICKKMKNWYFFDGTGTSGRGFIDWMYEHQNAEGVVIDEIDKLKRNEQAMLYNFLESGQIDYQTSKVRYHFRIDHIGARIKQDDRADDIERLINLMIKYGQINSNTEYN